MKRTPSADLQGFSYGFLGVLGFSLTLPVTRMGVGSLPPELVGPGRALLAVIPAALLLLLCHRPLLPPRHQLRAVLVTALGTVIGFPLLTAHALRTVSASHAALVVALLPATTAVMAVLRGRERPSGRFWVCCGLGTAIVLGYLSLGFGGGLHTGDAELLAAVVVCSLGYAEGGVLARDVPGWVVTSWSLVAGTPVAALVVVLAWPSQGPTLDARGAAAFVYLALGSSLLSFIAWYRGLSTGGVAKVGQIQLLQPVLTMLFAAVLLDEPLRPSTVLVGLAVGVVVLAAQRTRTANSGGPATTQERIVHDRRAGLE
ncbi:MULTISPECIES: DMT family transporter [Streptomyces]|uniref:DMT family transporter n=1 Tax=Streptomyces mirabilis TaxID=68239 RepID=A0ABU3UEW7_9ACTN|nr:MULTISPECIES: DMT family transporter [Streptomyces]MCX4613842.1 DMT family transporter [Streptomyces mirabilis]MCX5353969.1 DMT family transporter [Streptomyces mirabilis]MDU8992458.1 DMT family transporter [Streptomyces mirabilis]QDN91881.1 DMT family transporter [Streptomyces sp. RLB3-6]QDO12705.1 DMT family transporter [Streptomyces sp. S1D4-23]